MNTAKNIVYDSVDDETTFDIDVFLFNNPMGIDYSINAERNLQTRSLEVSKYRNLTNNFESYSLYFKDFTTEYKVLDFVPTQSLTGGTVTFTVMGDPFNNKTSIITETKEQVRLQILRTDHTFT